MSMSLQTPTTSRSSWASHTPTPCTFTSAATQTCHAPCWTEVGGEPGYGCGVKYWSGRAPAGRRLSRQRHRQVHFAMVGCGARSACLCARRGPRALSRRPHSPSSSMRSRATRRRSSSRTSSTGSTEVVRGVRFEGWQSTIRGDPEVRKALRSTLYVQFKIRDNDVFESALASMSADGRAYVVYIPRMAYRLVGRPTVEAHRCRSSTHCWP